MIESREGVRVRSDIKGHEFLMVCICTVEIKSMMSRHM